MSTQLRNPPALLMGAIRDEVDSIRHAAQVEELVLARQIATPSDAAAAAPPPCPAQP